MEIQPGIHIHLGDCLEVMSGIPEHSADAVVMDPPYFLPATHYNVRSRTFRSLTDLGILEHFFRSVFDSVNRVLKPDGFLYAFCDGQSYPVFYVAAYPHFKSLRPLIWDKQVSFNGYGWRHQHELILYGERSEAPPVKTGDGDVLRSRAVPIDEREHLAEKPVELLARLIKKSTVEGATVLDPFMGSGSTGLAAMSCGRNFIGIEKDAHYFDVAHQNLTGGKPQITLIDNTPHQQARLF